MRFDLVRCVTVYVRYDDDVTAAILFRKLMIYRLLVGLYCTLVWCCGAAAMSAMRYVCDVRVMFFMLLLCEIKIHIKLLELCSKRHEKIKSQF
jgi:hypothetical protein